jgi:hypothetical protein
MLDELARKFELASRAYANTNGIERDAGWFLLKLQEEMGELTQALEAQQRPRPPQGSLGRGNVTRPRGRDGRRARPYAAVRLRRAANRRKWLFWPDEA